MTADTVRETGALGTTITCPCGHTETVAATGVYRVIPWPRWHIDPATSTVSIVDAPRYICEPCWDAWPEDGPPPPALSGPVPTTEAQEGSTDDT